MFFEEFYCNPEGLEPQDRVTRPHQMLQAILLQNNDLKQVWIQNVFLFAVSKHFSWQKRISFSILIIEKIVFKNVFLMNFQEKRFRQDKRHCIWQKMFSGDWTNSQ